MYTTSHPAPRFQLCPDEKPSKDVLIKLDPDGDSSEYLVIPIDFKSKKDKFEVKVIEDASRAVKTKWSLPKQVSWKDDRGVKSVGAHDDSESNMDYDSTANAEGANQQDCFSDYEFNFPTIGQHVDKRTSKQAMKIFSGKKVKPGKKKKFIDKKNAVVYDLVHRSYMDPDGDVSEYVLVPNEKKNSENRKLFPLRLPEAALPPTRKLEKRPIPLKGPQPDWDPDIVATLDDGRNDNSGSDLDDDFVTKANAELPIASGDRSECASNEDYDSDGRFQFSDDDDDDDDGDKKGKYNFTEYSMTSAVSNCTEDVKFLNERFEKFCETHYTDDQIGALDFKNIEGSLSPNSKILKDLEEDFEKYKKKLLPYDNLKDVSLKNKTLLSAAQMSSEKEKLVNVVVELPPAYDIQSFRSTFSSSKRNLPTIIKVNEDKEKPEKISVNPWKRKLTKSSLNRLEADADDEMEEDEESCVSENKTVFSLSNIRPKDESSEEKRLRKQAVKLLQREKRKYKKQNKLISREEKQKLFASVMNSKNCKYIHLP